MTPRPPQWASNRNAFLIGAGLASAVGAICLLAGPLYSSVFGPTPPGDRDGDQQPTTESEVIDAQITECKGRDGFFQATVRVTNNDDRPRTPVLVVRWFANGGARLGEELVFVSRLEPGQTALEGALTTGADVPAAWCGLEVRGQ